MVLPRLNACRLRLDGNTAGLIIVSQLPFDKTPPLAIRSLIR
jgi:hypothetical protein